MSLLVTGVLGNEVEVLAADDDGTVHLGGDNGAGQDTATNGDETSEGALLVCTKFVLALFAITLGVHGRKLLFSSPPSAWLANFLELHRSPFIRNPALCSIHPAL